jgi:aspartate carbamoyltransferase catalytic subunit
MPSPSEKKEKIAGLPSLSWATLPTAGWQIEYLLSEKACPVRLIGPPTLIPKEFYAMGVEVFHNMEEGMKGVEVLMMLRIQMERQGKGFFPSTEEYSRNWGLTPARLALAEDDVIVMHPGPMNRGIEIASEIADGPKSVILEQVTNGIAVRMAVLSPRRG